MKHIKLLFLLLLVSTFGFGQYTVDFEDDTKGGYGSGTVTLNGLDWEMNEALIGNLANDFFNGTQSARLRGRNGSQISMINDKTNGIGTISFPYRSYGSDGAQQPWSVEYSTDGGTSWTHIGSDITATASVQNFNETVNSNGNIRVRIRLNSTPGTTGNRRLNIDDISITDFVCTDALDFVNTQFPNTSPQNITVGDNFTVFAQGFEPGITPGAGAGANVEAWIGYSNSNTNPSGTGWTWIPATYNTDVGNNDEFSAEIGSGLAIGTYYYASRWRLNGCDFNYGGTGGIWSNDSVQLIVNPDVTDFYNLQSPATGSINLGGIYNVYARAFEPGVTPTAGSDPSIEAWIGYSTTNTNPNTWTDWVPATFNAQFGNDDEYVADIGSVIPTPGTYYYASRFRLNGSSFTYGGITPPNGGDAWDGATYISGVLTIVDPCASIFSDDFSSGLTQWNNTGDWTTVAGELKHNLSGTAGVSTINSNIGLQNFNSGDYEWSLCIRNGSWDPSGGNNFSFVLLSDTDDTANDITGYRLGVNHVSGEVDDLLKLYRVNNGVDTVILTTAFDWDADDDVCIRVTRSNTGDWEMFYDDGSGEISGGTINDTQYSAGSFISLFFEYTSSRAGLLWIDDVNICKVPISCSTTSTWDGTSWSPSVPDASTNAILNADYNTSVVGQPEFTSCSLTINSGFDLTISTDDYVEVITNVINNGRIFIQDKGSFVQVDNAATYDDTGSSFFATDNAAQVTRTTAIVNNWYEYTYWSSPVSNETVEDALFTANPDRRFTFNAANFADLTYETNNDNGTTAYMAGDTLDDIDDNGDDWQFASGLMLQGVGYAATMSTTSITFGGPNFAHFFEGTLNNGDINVAVVRNNASNSLSTVPDNNWNFIGNPYPSAIDVDLFFAANNWSASNTNATLDGSIYLWSQNSPPSDTNNGNQALNFSGDYAVINGMGETAGGDMVIPTRHISSAQGFFVNFVDTAERASSFGNVIFNNAMRVRDNNSQFFRNSANTSSTSNTEKFRLNLTSDNGVFSQLLVGYNNTATDGFDGAYFDAAKSSSAGTPVVFGSSINNNSYVYAIQGKSINSLDENEIVPLAFSTSVNAPTIYTINLASIEGDFLSNNSVFLIDNLNNTYHDLSVSDYSFTSQIGEYNNRFKIVFNTNTLSTYDLDFNPQTLSIIELLDDNVKFSIASEDLTIKSIKILDVLGRTIYNFRGSKNTEVYNLANVSSSVYIAQIELSNGSLITKKAIKK